MYKLDRMVMIHAAMALHHGCEENRDKPNCNGCSLRVFGRCQAHTPAEWLMSSVVRQENQKEITIEDIEDYMQPVESRFD